MGKSRRNRGGASQRRDASAKSVKPPSDPELAALREAKILPVVRNLEAADSKARSAAAAAITSLIQDEKARKLLLREGIVHTILTRIVTDAAPESRAAGWAILQALAQEEEADFCVHLYRSDVTTAIRSAAKTVGEMLLSQGSALVRLPGAANAWIADTTASLVALLTALAEASDEILEAISADATITDLLFLLVMITGDDGSRSLESRRSDALACLMILTEDNGDLAERLVANAACFQALSTLKSETNADGVLACAVLHNVFASLESLQNPPRVPNADDSVLIPTLTSIIATAQPSPVITNGNHGQSSTVEQQQLALETIASIGTSLNSGNRDDAAPLKSRGTRPPKDDQDMEDAEDDSGSAAADEGETSAADDDNDDDDDDEMDEDEMQADMEMVTGADDGESDDNIDDMPGLKLLLRDTMPELVRVATFPPNSEDALRLQSHALSALNNIAWSISLVDFSDDQNAGILQAWTPIGRSLWEQVITPILSSDTADVSLATVVTSLAWAVARSLGGNTPLQGNEHQKFTALYQATQSMPPPSSSTSDAQQDPFQRLGVKCIGVLGQLAMPPAAVPLNRAIGAFLVDLVAQLPGTPAADAVEALNQLFDIYADEDAACDAQVFWQDGFLARLEDVLPKARAMAKSVNKKTFPELRTRADEAVMNLGRFLAYKKKHKRPRDVNGAS
ncbi:ARM-like repeat-containing protein [Moelleriella libera RCEF 2490]|uniref:ARM-like repeat-containing protein n=1 Tax=Moelleriella libera RCEF 2490 TaxID=1081109 RepID=A0A168BJ05_9HYPO|nr:ARM-like repeat-containing protein [Moelleriella libera RCEF 2490]